MELIINSKTYGIHTVYYDEQDHELISRFKWSISKAKDKDDNDVFYARGHVKNKYLEEHGQRRIRMHRVIMNAKKNEQVDHINHDGLDNRRLNLRIATQAQNSANMRVSKDSLTGFKGVTLRKKKMLYVVRIRVDGKLIHGGLHKNIHKAALKYNEMAIKYFGEFACLNILTPEQIEDSKREMPMRALSSNKTGYRGVSISKVGGKKPYLATLRVNNRNMHLGSYETPEKAAKAYNEAVIKYGKPLIYLNKIPE